MFGLEFVFVGVGNCEGSVLLVLELLVVSSPKFVTRSCAVPLRNGGLASGGTSTVGLLTRGGEDTVITLLW